MVPLMFLTFALGVGGDRRRVPLRPRRLPAGAAGARRCAPVGHRRGRAAAGARCCRRRCCCSPRSSASTRSPRPAAKRGGPARDLPLAIFIAVGVVALFYFLFTAAVYHTAPWAYVAAEAQRRDVTAPGLLGVVLPPFWTVVIVSSASVALIKDLPAMLLGVSRLMFAWAEDGIFPAGGRRGAPALPHPARGHPAQRRHGHDRRPRLPPRRRLVPRRRHPGDLDAHQLPADGAVGAGAAVAQPGAGGGDRRCCRRAAHQVPVAVAGVVVLALFLAVHTWRDLTGRRRPGTSSPTPVWAIVMALATVVYCARDAPAARQGRGCRGALRAHCRRNRRPMLRSIDRIDLAPGLSISRVVTGLWQIADMERGGRTLDLDAAARAMQPVHRGRASPRSTWPTTTARPSSSPAAPGRTRARAASTCSSSPSGCRRPARSRPPTCAPRSSARSSGCACRPSTCCSSTPGTTPTRRGSTRCSTCTICSARGSSATSA